MKFIWQHDVDSVVDDKVECWQNVNEIKYQNAASENDFFSRSFSFLRRLTNYRPPPLHTLESQFLENAMVWWHLA